MLKKLISEIRPRLFTFYCLLFTLLLSACTTYTQFDIDNANYLASKKNIQDHSSDPAQYLFDEGIPRAEIVGMALAMDGIRRNEKCRGDFTDVTNSADDMVCHTMETGADHGFISKDTKLARPDDDVLRAEALAIFMKTFPDSGGWAGYSYYWEANFPFDGDDVGYRGAYIFGAEWEARTFYDYIRKVLRDDTQLKVHPWPEVKATRRDVFEFAANIMKYKEKNM